jgi:NTE family protein
MTRKAIVPRRGLSRRRFLALAASLTLLSCSRAPWGPRPRIGLALGGGGAKGLAHIPMLEALDELSIQPAMIAGTSVGAIIGALYASGLSGKDIRDLVEQFLVQKEDEQQWLPLPRSLRWLDFIDPLNGRGGLMSSDDFIAYLGEVMPARRFRDLQIPLKIVTAALWSGEAVILDAGPLLPAIQASMALPGVFPPVKHNGRELVDGGVANPLPYDLLKDQCDLVIAVDVSGDRKLDDEDSMSFMGVLFHSFHTMSHNILAEKLKQTQPDIYIRPESTNVRVLEFYKAREIFAQALPAKQRLTKALKRVDYRPGCNLSWLR